MSKIPGLIQKPSHILVLWERKTAKGYTQPIQQTMRKGGGIKASSNTNA